jgi:hypothetical protein
LFDFTSINWQAQIFALFFSTGAFLIELSSTEVLKKGIADFGVALVARAHNNSAGRIILRFRGFMVQH